MSFEKGSTRQTLEKVLGHEVEDQQWQRMIELGWVLPDEITIEGEGDINWLATEYRKTWTVPVVKREPVRITPPKEERKKGIPSLGEAISSLFAWHAHGDEEVQSFRKDVIGKEMSESFEMPEEVRLLELQPLDFPVPSKMIDKLGKKDQKVPMAGVSFKDAFTVEAWINRHFEREKKEAGPSPYAGVSEIFFLDYGVPAGPGENAWRTVPVIPGGVLDTLRNISERLSKTYRWNKAQATLFVLIGGTPWVSRMSASFDVSHEFPAATRIELTIDPALPPEKVTAFYKECREKILKKPMREPRPKALVLAIFAASMEIEKGKAQVDSKRWTWEQKQRSWNKTFGKHHPEWKYEAGQASNFMRDYKGAKDKFLNPPFVRAKNLEQKIRFFFDRDFDKLKEGE